MLQLRRRPVERSGILRGPKRDWPQHRRFIRSRRCCVPVCFGRRIECAHVRTAANAGIAVKPPDWSCVPLCAEHHREQHQIGVESFESKYRIDLTAIAERCAQLSPDKRMRDAMKENQGG